MTGESFRWHRRQRLPPEYALILLKLVMHHTYKGCYPTLGTIAEHSNVSVATAKRRLLALIVGGWISKTTAFREDGRRTVYTLHFDRTIHAPRNKKGFRAWLRDLTTKVPEQEPKAPAGSSKKQQVAFHFGRSMLLKDNN